MAVMMLNRAIFRQFGLVIGIILFIVLPFYLIGQSAANMDRQAGLATVKFPYMCGNEYYFSTNDLCI